MGRQLLGRPRRVLDALAAHDADVTFQGLRRRLGLHPQTLTRTLRRLEEDGRIERTPQGYRIAEEGRRLLQDGRPAPKRTTEVLRLLLPPHVTPEDVERALAGRWFDALRWYGRAEGPQERCLLWLTEPEGVLVRLRVLGGAVLVDVEAAWDDAAGALVALQALLGAIAPLFGGRLEV